MTSWIEEFREMYPGEDTTETETKKKKESSLSLQQELAAMDFRDKFFYKKLTDDQKKEIGLWVLMRFMSSSQNSAEHHLLMVNDLVNNNFSSISKHPELQWMLLSLCGTNKKQFHPWIAPPKGIKKNRVEQAIVDFYPLMKDDDLELFLKINTREDLEEFFKENGYDDKTIKELFDGKGK